MEWQDIETAPKDGGKIDVYFNGAGRITDVYYRTKGIAGWCRDHGFPQQTTVFFDSPTHWMPLPSPPKPTHKEKD